jgi:uncharacterized membrane protein
MMMAPALAVLLGLGHAIVALLVGHTKLYWFERWALAFLIGTAALSGLWLACGPFYGVIQPVWLLSLLSVVIMVYVARSRVRRWRSAVDVRPQKARVRPAPLDAVLSVALAAQFVALFLASLRTPLGWDGLFNFEIKARLIFENDPSGRFPWAYLSDASRVWSHPQYPLMVPFAEFWIYSWLGRVDQGAVKILFPLFYFSLIGLVCGAARRMATARVSLLTGVAMGLLPPLTLLPGAASGYADVPLAAALVGSVCFALLALQTRNAEAWVVAGVLSAIATWTKSEGVLLAGCVAAAAFAALKTGSDPVRSMRPLVWMPLAAALPWLLVQHRYGMPLADFMPVSTGAVLVSVTRLQGVADIFARELLRPGHWGAIWPAWCAAIVLVVAFRRPRASEWLLVGTVALPLVLYLIVFTWSAWPDPLEHARTALSRLLVPMAPIALMFTILTFYDGLFVEAA